MNSLQQTRQDVADLLVGAGMTVHKNVPPAFAPPLAVLQPGDPYVETGDTFDTAAFIVTFRLTIISGAGTNEVQMDYLDSQICSAVALLAGDQWTISVGEPYAVTNGNGEYPAVDISIQNQITIEGSDI